MVQRSYHRRTWRCSLLLFSPSSSFTLKNLWSQQATFPVTSSLSRKNTLQPLSPPSSNGQPALSFLSLKYLSLTAFSYASPPKNNQTKALPLKISATFLFQADLSTTCFAPTTISLEKATPAPLLYSLPLTDKRSPQNISQPAEKAPSPTLLSTAKYSSDSLFPGVNF